MALIKSGIQDLQKNPPKDLSKKETSALKKETSTLKKNFNTYLKKVDPMTVLKDDSQIAQYINNGASILKWLNEVHTTPINWDNYYKAISNFDNHLDKYLNNYYEWRDLPIFKDLEKQRINREYRPDPLNYSTNYTKGEKIIEAYNSGKGITQKVSNVGKLLKDNKTAGLKNAIKGVSKLEVAGFALNVIDCGLNIYNSWEEIGNARNTAANANLSEKWHVYQEALKAQDGVKYDKLNLSAMDAIGSGVGLVVGTAILGTAGLPLAVAGGLLIAGGTALAKTFYSTSQHKDASFWKTLGENLNPLDFSNSTYVQKKANMPVSYENVAEEQDIITMSGGAGNDTLMNSRSKFVAITGGAGNDAIINQSSNNVTISGGAGDDSITNLYSSKVTINAEEGDDQINNYSNSVKIDAGVGNNTIKSFDSKDVFIIANKGNDNIDNSGNSNTISAGDGNNVISNIGAGVSIKSGKGSDKIDNLGVQVKIDSSAGDDYITTEGNAVTILSGAGKDIVENTDSSQVLIDTGTGDDYIESNGDANTIKSGSNDDIINNVGNSNFIDAGKGSNYIENVGNSNTINGGSSKDYIVSVGEGNSLIAGSGNDYIENAGNFNSINAGTGDDYIESNGDSNLIKGGDGNDLIFVDTGSENTVFGGANNDIIFGEDGDDEFYGEAGNDSLSGGKGNDTLSGGTGNDKLLGGDGNDLFIYSAGKDIIGDYATGDKIKISAAITKSTFKGSDAIFTINKDTLTIKNGKDKEIIFITENGKERTIIGGALIATKSTTLESWRVFADASEHTEAIKLVGNSLNNSILGGKGNDEFYGQKGNDTLNGGEGDDTLSGGEGNDVFIYSSGKDVITDYTAGDRISLGAAVSKATVSGPDVVFMIGKGSLKVKDAKGKSLSMIDSAVKSFSTIVGSTTLNVTNSTKSPVTVDSAIKIINASSRTKAVKITGNSLANTITGGSGKDYLCGSEGSDKIYGGKGNDSLWGGADNDSLWGDGGNDIFIYKAGEGTDYIFDYAAGDMLQILDATGAAGSFSKSKFSNDTLSMTINGGGKIIFKNVSSTTNFNINNTAYRISGSKLVK